MSRMMLSNRTTRRVDVNGHRAPTIVLLILALYTLPQATSWRDGAVAALNPGYVLMIHAVAEPQSHQAVDDAKTGNGVLDQVKTIFTHGNEALTASKNDGSIVFHAIPYRADTVYPVVVGDPRLEVQAVGSDRRLMLKPNVPAGGKICHVETSWADHEGPLEACTVYKVPAAAFDGMNVVTLTLHFTDATGPQHRVHNGFAHGLLHLAIGGAPIDLKAIDATTTEPTPLVIQNLIETKSM